MRYAIIDGFRGYFLFMMMIVHMNTIVQAWLLPRLNHHGLGFVEDAQGFVFVSGLVAGIVYGRMLLTRSASAMRSAVFGRVRQIWIYHALLVCMITASALWAASAGIDSTSYDRFGEAPLLQGLLSLLLLSGPRLAAILPMYVVFMALVPFVLEAIARGQVAAVAALSVAAWVFAQTGVIDAFLLHLDDGLDLEDFGLSLGIHFNRFGWQILFCFGLIAGMYWSQGKLDLSFLARREWRPVFAVAFATSLGFCVLRLSVGDGPFSGPIGSALNVSAARSPLAILRLANFTADLFVVVWLLVAGASSARRSLRAAAAVLHAVFTWRPLVFLGQHSLQVYAYHVFLIYLTNLTVDTSGWAGWQKEAFLLACGLSLFLPALAHARFQARRRAAVA